MTYGKHIAQNVGLIYVQIVFFPSPPPFPLPQNLKHPLCHCDMTQSERETQGGGFFVVFVVLVAICT